MLQFFFMLITAPTLPVCEIPTASAPLTANQHQPDEARGDRHGLLHRVRGRLADRRARRDRNQIDRTLRHFFRSLQHRRAERRAHRRPGPLARFRDRRRHDVQPDDDAPISPGVTVPHEDPVDLPLYPQPNQ